MKFIHNGKEIAPCIVSKSRFALGTKNIKPQNSKKCSPDYWANTIRTVAAVTNPSVTIEDAIARYDELISGA